MGLIKMKPRAEQMKLKLKERIGWGGKRRNAGRKRRGPKRMPHRARPEHKKVHPVHITLRLVHGVGNLRRKAPFRLIKQAMIEGKLRDDFRLVHFSVQGNHLHLIVEANDARALSNAIRALEIRIAHKINRFEHRRGRLFADRFHAHALTTPRETRQALAYVLLNSRRHAQQRGVVLPRNWIDPYASGVYFDGWPISVDPPDPAGQHPVVRASVWLLTKGWRRRYAPIPFDEVPGSCARFTAS
jgi:REP element-mobilizing transposase RayT